MGISLSHARYEEIKQIVVDLFVEYDVCCVPVNGFELATKMGIKVIPYSAIPESKRWLLLKKSEDGFSVEKNIGEWYIYYYDNFKLYYWHGATLVGKYRLPQLVFIQSLSELSKLCRLFLTKSRQTHRFPPK